MKPLIGITCNVMRQDPDRSIYRGKELHYGDLAMTLAVSRAGGLPVLLPIPTSLEEISDVAQLLDGLILSSGLDVNPESYGSFERPTLESWAETLERDRFEISLTKEFLRLRRPVLGICRGLQVLNVARGGTLIDDLPSGETVHRDSGTYDKNCHSIQVEPNSLLFTTIGIGPHKIVSVHHQAIDLLGSGLTVSARSPDGIIEAIEAADQPFCLGVQWHPEWKNDASSGALFCRLVAESINRISKKNNNPQALKN